MSKVSLLPIENPKIKYVSADQEWKHEVTERLKGLQNKPINAPILQEVPITIESIINGGSGVTYIPSLVEQAAGTKFYAFGTDIWTNSLSLQPTRYRLGNVRDIVASFDVRVIPEGTGGTPPSASGDYSINFYLSIINFNEIIDGVITPTNIEYLFSYPVEFSWDDTAGTWSITNPSVDFVLSDYIEYRNLIYVSGTPFDDFNDTTDFNKNNAITRDQYTELTNQDNVLAGFFGVAFDEYTALSSGDKTHFDYYFNTQFASGAVYYIPKVYFRLHYYGLSASYQPNN